MLPQQKSSVVLFFLGEAKNFLNDPQMSYQLVLLITDSFILFAVSKSFFLLQMV